MIAGEELDFEHEQAIVAVRAASPRAVMGLDLAAIILQPLEVARDVLNDLGELGVVMAQPEAPGVVAVAWCRVCGCTELHACGDGCSWVEMPNAVGAGLCSSCPPAHRQPPRPSPVPCRACEIRKMRGFDGQCPACATDRTRQARKRGKR